MSLRNSNNYQLYSLSRLVITLSLCGLPHVALDSVDVESPLEKTRETVGCDLLTRYEKAIVGIECEVSAVISVNGRAMPPRSQTREGNGVIVSPTGLVLTALTVFEPNPGVPGMPVRVEEVQIGNIRLHLGDGTELPGQLVQKVESLGLAFVRAAKDSGIEGKVSIVELSPTAAPKLLATCFEISRAPRQQGWVPMIRVVEVAGFAESPRHSILTSVPVAPGCPVIDAQGYFVGLGAKLPTIGFSGAPTIIPASDVAEATRQVISSVANESH